jgi:uncharacterized protein YeaO (DUF488 family)
MIRTKSVHSPIEPRKDGLRVLATRFRGRGLPAARYDVWMANLAPSEALLRSFQGGKLTWAEFRRRYRKELFESGSADSRNRTIRNRGQKFTLRLLGHLAQRGPVTLLCHCADEEPQCHRHVLADLLRDQGTPSEPVLSLNLIREYFRAIANGEKRIEYRDRTPYWRRRLEGRSYGVVHFRNGYATKAPEMQVEIRGVRKTTKGGEKCYAISLGRVLWVRRWKE